MTSRNRGGDAAKACASHAAQSDSKLARLPRQKSEARIREVKLTDAPELAALMCQLGYQTGRTEMKARLRSILSNPAFKTFVAIMDGCVCGMIGTIAYPSYEHNDPGGRILALVTSTATRRRGIGRALIAAAEKNFAQRGILRVALNTSLIRENAHKFYESLGYERSGWRFVKQLAVCDWCD